MKKILLFMLPLLFLFIGCEDKDEPLPLDCAGIEGGIAQSDSCGFCVGGTTGEVACNQDCANVWGGTAQVDSCGICNGNNSSCSGCTDSSAVNYDSTATFDDSSCYYGAIAIIQSNPPGAFIAFNGIPTGYTTPHTFTDLSLGFHHIQVYVNQDFSDLDTTIIFNLYEDIATILVGIYPLWDYEWVGSITVDGYNPFYPSSGEKTVPTTLGAKIEVSYSSYDDCGGCSPSNYDLYFGQEEFSLIDCGSPCILEKGIELFEGQTGEVRISVGCIGVGCMPNIVITSIILSTN